MKILPMGQIDIPIPEENIQDWVYFILRKAIENSASDIHFDPQEETIDIRFRIDGLLYLIKKIAKVSQDKVISRVKVLASMDITEHRLPQDGHFELNYEQRIYNVRVSTFPTEYGEAIALRILNRENVLFKMEALGFDNDQLEVLNRLIISPSGIVLITGPTASGKTSILYSILNILDKSEKNIVTIEDPIELQMKNVRQLQIRDTIGLSFAKAMRAVLRQDPDVIMLGEIRDPETAKMAVQAALSGILIFSTFHTMDVPGLVSRLIEMGIPRSVVAQSITGVISTRLIRKICDSCKTPYELNEREKRIVIDKSLNFSALKGKGCNLCHGSGYLGRTGVYEITYFDESIRYHIIENTSASSLAELLASKRVKDLRTSALDKVTAGITTLEEIIRVVGIPI